MARQTIERRQVQRRLSDSESNALRERVRRGAAQIQQQQEQPRSNYANVERRQLPTAQSEAAENLKPRPAETASGRAMHNRLLEQGAEPTQLVKSTLGSAVPTSRNPFIQGQVNPNLLPANQNVRAVSVPSAPNPISAGYQQLIHGAQGAVNAEERPTSEVPTTGNRFADRIIRETGSFLPGIATGQSEAQALGTVSRGVEYGINKIAPKVSPFIARIAGHAAEAGIENARVGAAAGQTSGRQVGENLAIGAGFGAGGKVLGETAGAAKRYATKTAEELVGNQLGRAEKLSTGRTVPRRVVGTSNPVAEEVPVTAPKSAGVEPPVSPEPSVTTPRPREPQERANFGTQLESEAISPELKSTIETLNKRYEPITNAETVAAADTAIAEKGVKQATFDFLTRTEKDAQHIAEGYRLMQLLDNAGDFKGAAGVAAKVAADLTEAGQKVQAAKIIKRLSPEGQLLTLTRKAIDNKKEVTPEDLATFSKAAKEVQETAGAETRSNTIQDLIEKVKRGENVTEADLQSVQELVERAKNYVPEEAAASAPKQAKPSGTKRQAAIKALEAQKQAALARIKARRGQLNSLPLSEWRDHGIVIAADVAKGLINASNFVEKIVKEFGEDVRPAAGKIFRAAQKTVQANPDLRIKPQKVYEVGELVKKFAAQTPTTTADLKKIESLAKDVKNLEGKKGRAAEVQLQQIMNKYNKGSFWDKVNATRYVAMLLNTGTQLLNVASGVIQATGNNTLDLFTAMFESIVNPIIRKERTTVTHGYNPIQYIGEMFKNLGIGAKANFQGVSPGNLENLAELRGLAFNPANKINRINPLAIGERVLRAVAGGGDYAIYKTEFDNEIRKQAKLAFKKADTQDRAKFIRDFVANPPSEALEVADQVAREATFQQKGTIGDIAANAVSSIGAKGKVGKVVEQIPRTITPFLRTPLNIAEVGVNMTPVGALRGIIQMARATTAVEKRRAVRTLGLGISGTGLSALGYYLKDAGVITGANDSGNKNLDAVREQAGHGKYRFNQSGLLRFLQSLANGDDWETTKKKAAYQEGDRTFDYNKLQPLAFPVALGAGFQEGKKEDGIVGGLKAAGSQGVGSLISQSALKGIQDVVATAPSGSEDEKQLGVVSKIAESYLKSFSPSLLAQEARREDTTQRKTAYNKGLIKDVTDYQKSRTPAALTKLGLPEKYTSKSLPENVTTLGAVKKNPAGVLQTYANPFRSEVQKFNKAAKIVSDLIDRTGDDSIAPKPPSKNISGTSRITKKHETKPIPAERYAKLQKDIGTEVTNRILAIDLNLTDKKKVERITEIYQTVRDKYFDRLKKEFGFYIN